MANNRMVVFSDVQGNSVALQAMFEHLQKLPDFETLDYICLGDSASGYAPNTVLDLLREHDVRSVKGNMDDVILYPKAYSGKNDDEKLFNEMDLWCNAQLTPINRDYLKATPLKIITELFGAEYCFAHGSYYDYNTALDASSSFVLAIPTTSDVIFTGHTHQQFKVATFNHKTAINPGSIGFPDPMKKNGKRPLRAQFAMIEEGRFEFVTLYYKREDFSFAVMNSGMPHAVWYLSQWDI